MEDEFIGCSRVESIAETRWQLVVYVDAMCH